MKKLFVFLIAIAIHGISLSQVEIKGNMTINPNTATGIIELGPNGSSFTCKDLTFGQVVAPINYVILNVAQLNCDDLVIGAGIERIKLQKDLKIDCETISHATGGTQTVKVEGQGTLTVITKNATTGNIMFVSANKNVFIKTGHK